MILLTLTLGSRNHFLPESPTLPMITCFARRFCGYSSMFLETLCTLPYSSWPPVILVNNLLAICTFIPSCSCCYKIPLGLSDVPRILVPSALQLLFALRIIHLTGVRSSLVVHMLFKILGNTTRSFEYPLQTIALQLLVCLHYGCFPYV